MIKQQRQQKAPPHTTHASRATAQRPCPQCVCCCVLYPHGMKGVRQRPWLAGESRTEVICHIGGRPHGSVRSRAPATLRSGAHAAVTVNSPPLFPWDSGNSPPRRLSIPARFPLWGEPARSALKQFGVRTIVGEDLPGLQPHVVLVRLGRLRRALRAAPLHVAAILHPDRAVGAGHLIQRVPNLRRAHDVTSSTGPHTH
jgi:hypothetical protein